MLFFKNEVRICLYPLICTSLEKIDAVEVTVLAVEFVKEILPIFTDKKNLLFFFNALNMTLAKDKAHLYSLVWITAFFFL